MLEEPPRPEEAEVFLDIVTSTDSDESVEEHSGCNDLDSAIADLDDGVQTYSATSGDLTLEEADSGAWRVDFVADLQDEGGDEVSAAEGGFGASHCEIKLGDGAGSFWLNPWTWMPWAVE